MKNYSVLILAFLLSSLYTQGQEKYLTKTGITSFFSDAIIEDIKAENKETLSIIETKTGTIAIAIPMKGFQFKKSLMQEHFNENYVESDKYPKATFKGEIVNFSELSEEKTTTVKVQGDLTIHGVTRKTDVMAAMTKTKEHIILKGNFPVRLEDFDVKIPKIVIKKIAEEVAVQFDLNHKPYTK